MAKHWQIQLHIHSKESNTQGRKEREAANQSTNWLLRPKNMNHYRREGTELSSLIEPTFALESQNKTDRALYRQNGELHELLFSAHKRVNPKLFNKYWRHELWFRLHCGFLGQKSAQVMTTIRYLFFYNE